MFSFFKKQASTVSTTAPATGPAKYDGEKLKAFMASLKFVYRDAELSEEIRERYTAGLFFRDPTFCDSTHKFGGVIGNTRFLLVTSSPISLDGISASPEWGLNVFQTNQIFKVLGSVFAADKTQVTVLHVPDEFLGFFQSDLSKSFDDLVLAQTKNDFREAVLAVPLVELNTEEWRNRTKDPIGMRVDKTFFPI